MKIIINTFFVAILLVAGTMAYASISQPLPLPVAQRPNIDGPNRSQQQANLFGSIRWTNYVPVIDRPNENL